MKTAPAKHWTGDLDAIGACPDAIVWSRDYDTLQAAWDDCERGDWMLWLIGITSGDDPETPSRKKLAICSVEVAKLAWPYVREQDREAVQQCYETAESWAHGDGATQADCRAASDAIFASAGFAYAASYAAYAAAAAEAAAAKAAAAAAAAEAAAAAAAATTVVIHAVTTSMATLSQAADIVRRHYPEPPKL